MPPTPLPSLRELFPNLIGPRGDDQNMSSRPITPRLVLDRVSPYAHSERHSPTTPVSPTCLRRGPYSGRGPPPPEASRPIDAEDCHDQKTRKHVCHHCGKRFNRPSSLTIHYHTHTGERPYPCPYPGCLRTFNVSSNMRRHYRNHEFLANNRPQPQPTTLQTSFYSPPPTQGMYPPPPLRCGFR